MFSTTTSAPCTRRRKAAWPAGGFRSSATARLFDNSVILLDLAEKTGRFLPEPKSRGEMLSWLMFTASGIGEFPRVSDKLAMMVAETVLARELTHVAAEEKEKGHPASSTSSRAPQRSRRR